MKLLLRFLYNFYVFNPLGLHMHSYHIPMFFFISDITYA